MVSHLGICICIYPTVLLFLKNEKPDWKKIFFISTYCFRFVFGITSLVSEIKHKEDKLEKILFTIHNTVHNVVLRRSCTVPYADKICVYRGGGGFGFFWL